MTLENTKLKKITNYYKAICIIQSYKISDYNPDRFSDDKIVRKPYFDPLINSNVFSEIDDSSLNLLKDRFNDPGDLEYDSVKSSFCNIVSYGTRKFSDEDINLLKKLGMNGLKRNLSYEEAEDAFKEFFIGERFFKASMQNLSASINAEIEARNKKIKMTTPSSPKGSLDDSLLVEFHNKAKKCKTLDDFEKLLLYYITNQGCDLMNGFFYGNLTTLKDNNKLKLKSTFSTGQNISIPLLLDTAQKALELRKAIIYGTLRENTDVYRGLGYSSFLSFIKTNQNAIENLPLFKGRELSKAQMLSDYIIFKKPNYQSNAITSTSYDKEVGESFAYDFNSGTPVLMVIKLKKGTAFGKDFRDTSFKHEDERYEKEIILKPGQIIKTKKASVYRTPSGQNGVKVECETSN